MTRIRTIAALTVVAALALPGAALATTVNGGTTQLAFSSAASTALSKQHLTVTPIAPASASGSTLAFPISHGWLNTKNLHGVIGHSGGFKISNGSRSISVRRLELVSNKHGVWLDALYRARRRTHGKFTRVVIGIHKVVHVTNLSLQNGTATGTARLTGYSAGRINRLAHKTIGTAGKAIGTITVTPTFG